MPWLRNRRPGPGLAAFALLGCLATPSTAVDPSDSASRVRVKHLAGGGYAIRPANRSCPSRPAAGRTARLIGLAEAAWERFGSQEQTAITEERNPRAGLETDAAIAGFWTSVPDDGRGGYMEGVWQDWREDPSSARQRHWSAAFTSWLMCEAGFSLGEFARSPGHIRYVLHARDHHEIAAHMVVNVGDAPPHPGDLVCANRSDRTPSYADLPTSYPLHCFLVVQVASGEAHVIGGNVDGSVVRIRSPLAGTGEGARIVRRPDARWLLLMKLRGG